MTAHLERKIGAGNDLAPVQFPNLAFQTSLQLLSSNAWVDLFVAQPGLPRALHQFLVPTAALHAAAVRAALVGPLREVRGTPAFERVNKKPLGKPRQLKLKQVKCNIQLF